MTIRGALRVNCCDENVIVAVRLLQRLVAVGSCLRMHLERLRTMHTTCIVKRYISLAVGTASNGKRKLQDIFVKTNPISILSSGDLQNLRARIHLEAEPCAGG